LDYANTIVALKGKVEVSMFLSTIVFMSIFQKDMLMKIMRTNNPYAPILFSVFIFENKVLKFIK
jgi:hypothetical protein